MSKTAFESIKAGLRRAIQHQRNQRSGVAIIKPKAANHLDAKHKT